MPNWVWNELTIDKKDKDLILNENGEVDFGILVPMPEELKRTIAGGMINACMAYAYLLDHKRDEFINSGFYSAVSYQLKKNMSKNTMLETLEKRIGDNPEMFNDEAETEMRKDKDGVLRCYVKEKNYGHTPEEVGRYYIGLLEKYKVLDWYSWSNRNWGVKWNASETDVTELKGGKLDITFNTPWGPPAEWLQTVAEYMPFHMAWEEEQGYRGIIHNNTRDGMVEDVDLHEDGDYERVEDNYGDSWREYLLNDIDVRTKATYKKMNEKKESFFNKEKEDPEMER